MGSCQGEPEAAEVLLCCNTNYSARDRKNETFDSENQL